MSIQNQVKRPVWLLTALAGFAATSMAQTLVQTNGTVLAANGGQVPGVAAGITWGGTSTFDTGVMDDNGVIFFRGRMTDLTGTLGVTPLNDRGLFLGTTVGDLQLLYRGSDPAPTLPGLTLNTGTSTQMGGSGRVSANGRLFWGAPLSGAGVTTSTDTALFGGPVGSQVVIVREGDQAPGAAVGTLLSSSFSNPSQQPTATNGSGRVAFQSATTAGDTTTANNAMWVTGTPGSLEQIIRKGDTAPGTGGAVIGSLGFNVIMNDSGQVLHDESLSTTLGAPPATAANNAVMYVYTPGSGNTLLAREGDPAPGTTGALFANSSNSFGFGFGMNSFTATGQTFLQCQLFSGDAVTGSNDYALYVGGTGGLTMILRRGDPVPTLPGVTWGITNNSSMAMNNSGRVAFQNTLAGGGIDTSNDGTIVTGDSSNPASLQIVVREGDPAPGTVGATIAAFVGQQMLFNARGQILFNADLTGGDTQLTTSRALYLWDPLSGLHLVVRGDDPIEVLPGVFRNAASWGGIQFHNGDGNSLTFNKYGKITVRINMQDGTAAIVSISPPSSVQSFCAGDGVSTDHTTPCPCGNNGAAGNGCANSTNANGGNLTTSGSTFLDTETLVGSGMPSTSSCIYLQGDALADVTFGDGVRCAGGTLIRLRTRFNVAGASTFPDSTDTVTLSARGGVVPGSGARRYYQTYYRNAATLFCPPETFNVTNGVVIDW